VSEELPEGWDRVPLSDLLEPGGLFDGPFGSSLKTSDYTDAGVRVIRLENIANLRFVEDKQTFISDLKYRTLTKHTVGEGDIVVGSFVDGAVRVCILPSLPTKAIAKADCFTVRPRVDIADRKFIALQLGTVAVRDTFVGDIHGATRPRITTKQLRACELAIAPRPEQRRIVEKVEALLEQVNQAKARLDRVPVILKRFRQSVLAAACSGELTREWRSRHAHGIGTVCITDEGLPPLPEFPDEWSLVPLEHVVERFQYGTSEKASATETGGVPVLRMGNIQEGQLDLSDLKFIERSLVEDFIVRRGDVLFNRTNSPELVGKTAVVDSERTMAFASYLIRAQVGAQVRPEFVGWWINSGWGRLWARHIRTDGVSQSNINSTKLAAMPMPLPSVEEQDEVIRVGSALLRLADAIERRVKLGSARADRLPQAILCKAFSGDLVPTEAELARAEGRTYETAEELLKRVAASSVQAQSRNEVRPTRRKRKAG
jgi:type I restriction enzyme, S subunit